MLPKTILKVHKQATGNNETKDFKEPIEIIDDNVIINDDTNIENNVLHLELPQTMINQNNQKVKMDEQDH